MEYHSLSIGQLQKALVEKRFSAKEFFQGTLGKIKEEEHKIGAFISVAEEEVLKKGQDLDLKIQKGESLGNLEGALYSVKDNIMVKNYKCTCASQMLKNFMAPYDAEAVEEVSRRGGVLLGKTNLDEFAMGSSTENSGFKITRNPWDYKRVAGGSSGGSAAAVAAGFGQFSLGSDTGGSIRQPASFCGVLGIKPTYGLISRQGLVSFAPSMDQIGVLSNNVWDMARVMDAIVGPTGSKDYTLVRKKPDKYYGKLLSFSEERRSLKEKLLKGITIGIPKEFFETSLDKEVEKSLEAAMEAFKHQGANLISTSIPHFAYGLSAYYVITMVEAVSNLARFDGVAYGKRASKYEDVMEIMEKSRSRGFGDEVKRRLILGNHILNNEKKSLYRAKNLQERLTKDFQKAFQQCDFLLTPTTHTTAFKVGKRNENPMDIQGLDELTVAVSLAGLPAITVPCPKFGSLPVGGQLIGNHFKESLLLRGALALETDLEAYYEHGKEAR